VANNELGELRRSSVVMTFAPGAVVDFRAGGAAVSAVVGGLEEWDRSFPPAGLANPQVIYEPRLQRKLRIEGFRLPPVRLDRLGSETEDTRALVATRFPRWLQCPHCDTIAPATRWPNDPGRAYRYCHTCTERQPGRRRIMVIPVRFVVACSAGHLDEFPWHWWVGHKPECRNRGKGDAALVLRAERAGLAGLVLSCPACEGKQSMERIFKSDALRGARCHARRPWLSIEADPQGCETRPGLPPPQLRVVQRGASNLFFPVIESALSIPPWADELQQTLGMYWSPIMNTASPGDRRRFIHLLAGGALTEALRHLRLNADQLADLVESRTQRLEDTRGEDLRLEEYRRLTAGIDTEPDEQLEFEIRNSTVPPGLRNYVGRLVRVTRLREVRAITGFTRIYPPEAGDVPIAPLASGPISWLPAIEVRGEGVFLTLEEEQLLRWEAIPGVEGRTKRLRDVFAAEWLQRHGQRPLPIDISPRLVLLHTLAHALIRELTLECGYSTASLRERLYCDSAAAQMAGVLIYTATADSDGTLGGLERQGLPARFEQILVNSIEALRWCSSDPLCIEGAMGGVETFSLAACHACCLAPETSCEHYNRFLDRALLTGTPDDPHLGFFSALT
jgi:hypothetical protein